MTATEKRITNKEFTNLTTFIRACEKANIPPTRRQASKFRRGLGAAFAAMKKETPK